MLILPRLPRWFRTSLRHKLLAVIVGVEIVMLALLLGNTLRLFNATIEDQARQRVNEMNPVLDVALAPGLFRRDYAGTQDVLNDLLSKSGGSIGYLVVLDERGRVFASAGAVNTDALPPLGNNTEQLTPRLDTSLPLRIGTERVGELRYGLSLTSLFEARRAVLWQGAMIAAVEVFLATAVLTLLAIWLTRNLQHLVATTHAVAAGNYAVQAVVHSDDEIGRLARDFNAMSAAVRERTEQLQKRDEAISAMNADLTQRVRARTAELEATNKELEAFSYSVSHDLRAPLRAVDGFSQALLEDYGKQLDATGQNYLQRVRAGAQNMGALIDDMLKLSRVTRTPLQPAAVDLSAMAREIVSQLRHNEPGRNVRIDIADGLGAHGDPGLLRVVLENLLGNAWKYTGKTTSAQISFDAERHEGRTIFRIRDNGAGFDMRYADKLFGAFQRLHSPHEFPGTGVGLATVARILERHGGRVWAESEPGKGATFYLEIPQ